MMEEIFESIYQVFGYQYYNPLYRSAKLAIYKAGEVLVKGGVMTDFSIEKLDELLKSVGKPSCISLYKNLRKNPRGVQRELTASSLSDKIILAAYNVPNTRFSQTEEDQIRSIFNSYIEEVTAHRFTDPKYIVPTMFL
jgi:hypothetical protein